MTIAFIGDLHVGKLESLIPSSTDKQLRALGTVINKVRKKWVKDVVIAGDIFDVPHPKQSLIVRFLDVLAKYKGIRYHICPGNHDWLSNEAHAFQIFKWLADNAHVDMKVYMTPELVKIDGHQYWICPHPYIKDQPKEAVASIGHFAWAGAMNDNGSINKATNSPKGFWLLNDYHTHQSGKRYVYAGSLTKLSFQEEGPKGYLEIDGKDFKFVELSDAERGYDLRKIVVADDKQFKNIAKVPKTTYISVVFADDFTPPKNWQDKHPNIVRHLYRTKDGKVEKKSRFTFDFSETPEHGLDAWLVANTELDRASRKRASELMIKYSKARV